MSAAIELRDALLTPRGRALLDVSKERVRQEAKWGQQNHPDGTGPELIPLQHTSINLDLRTGRELADILRASCDGKAQYGRETWLDILLEEVGEASAEDAADKLRAELVQVAAVAVAWIEHIDRRADS